MAEKYLASLVLLVAILVFTISGAAVFRAAIGEQWEYRIEDVETPEFAAVLSRFGVEGWELVYVLPGTGPESAGRVYECIFKRRVGLWRMLMPQ